MLRLLQQDAYSYLKVQGTVPALPDAGLDTPVQVPTSLGLPAEPPQLPKCHYSLTQAGEVQNVDAPGQPALASS